MSGITETEREALKRLLKKYGDKRTEHFNGLSEEEQERLSILMEECGEVIQAIGKIQRHGYESYNPNDPLKRTNRELLAIEMGDVLYASRLLSRNGDVPDKYIVECAKQKQMKIPKYLHHTES